jgi:hypothetical protein
MNGPIRLWQHGTFLSFAEKFGSVSQIFLQKDVQLHIRDRLIHGSTGNFVGFTHVHVMVFVVQTSTA